MDPFNDGYMQTGALISLISCATIVLSYCYKQRWKRHPNSILFWKSSIDMLYAVRFLHEWDQYTSSMGCHSLAALTQFCAISSEGWFLSMSLELYRCSTNPFTNIHQNMRWYHFFSWSMGLLFAVILWISPVDFSNASEHIHLCYVTENDTTLQLLYFLVIVISVFVAVGLFILENQSYPHGGLKEALQAKHDVILSARIFTTAYLIYQMVVILLWVASMVTEDLQSVHVSRIHNITGLVQTSKGLIDLIIWLSMNGLPFDGCCALPASEQDERSSLSSELDLDLQPQLNLALRKEVLHFTTRGIVAASSTAAKLKNAKCVQRLRLHELDMDVRFHDYHAREFQEIRRGFGIDEEKYRNSFLATCHERIQSGGSSGAFMFFTSDYLYVVKTVTTHDCTILLRMLPAYINHMRQHPYSHLTRYYGCHSIKMYGQVFNFVVMGNAIGRVSMHQFYDIKGSWINRNAKVRWIEL